MKLPPSFPCLSCLSLTEVRRLVKLLNELEDRHGALRQPPTAAAGKAARRLPARLPRHQCRHRHAHNQARPHGRYRRALRPERPTHPVREHRREARLPAVRHSGEEPPFAGARARNDAGELSAHARLSAAPAAARIEIRQERAGKGGGEAAQRGGLDRAADPVPQGQGCGTLCDRHEHHPRSRDRLLQFLSRRHPRGRTAPRAHQLRHAALARHHGQVPRAGSGSHADRLRIRTAAGLRDHGQFLRTAHGCVGRDGDGRHHHGSRYRHGRRARRFN